MNKWKYLSLIATLSLLLQATACFADDNVVDRFEAIIEKFELNVLKSPPKISPPETGIEEWYRRKIFLQNVSYDVKKTDSLVSPFSGEIQYNCNVKGTKGRTRKDVSEGPVNFQVNGGAEDICIALYAFQKHKWIQKKLTCSSKYFGWRVPSEGITVDCAALLPKSD